MDHRDMVDAQINFGIDQDQLIKHVAAMGGVTSMQNPITRSDVRIEPPFICSDPDRYALFEQHFWKWCEALWEINRIDPDVLISDRDWLLGDRHSGFLQGLSNAADGFPATRG